MLSSIILLEQNEAWYSGHADINLNYGRLKIREPQTHIVIFIQLFSYKWQMTQKSREAQTTNHRSSQLHHFWSMKESIGNKWNSCIFSYFHGVIPGNSRLFRIYPLWSTFPLNTAFVYRSLIIFNEQCLEKLSSNLSTLLTDDKTLILKTKQNTKEELLNKNTES